MTDEPETEEPMADEPIADQPIAEDHRHDDLHERLEHLDRRIASLEAALKEQARGGLGPHFYESGTVRPDPDDQTIAP